MNVNFRFRFAFGCKWNFIFVGSFVYGRKWKILFSRPLVYITKRSWSWTLGLVLVLKLRSWSWCWSWKKVLITSLLCVNFYSATQICIARTCYGNVAGWLGGSVCVTRRYHIKTAKPICKLLRPSASAIILVSSHTCAHTESQAEPLQQGPLCGNFWYFGGRIPTALRRLRWNFARPSGPLCPSALPSLNWIDVTSRPRGAKNLIFGLWVNLIPAVCHFAASCR